MFEEALNPGSPPRALAVLTALERVVVGLAAVVVRQSADPLLTFDRFQVAARDANPPPPGELGDEVEYALQQMFTTIARLAR